MRLYLRIWLLLLGLMVLATIVKLVVTLNASHQETLYAQRMMVPFEYPIALIDRSYPFYA